LNNHRFYELLLLIAASSMDPLKMIPVYWTDGSQTEKLWEGE
jgi:hypothetical protein